MKQSLEDLLAIAMETAQTADWITLRRHRKTGTGFYVVNGVLEHCGSSYDEGMMVEVFYNGSYAYAATPDLTADGVVEATLKAFDAVRAANFFQLVKFDESIRPNNYLHYQSKIDKQTIPATNEIVGYLKDLCSTLKVSDKIIHTYSSIHIEDEEIEMVTPLDGRIIQNFKKVGYGFGATARKDNVIQSRSYNGHSAMTFQGGWELFDIEELLKEAKRVGKEAVELLDAKDCPTDTRTLVLMPSQMMLQIHESIGHPLEIDRILGDELNFAGGSFVKPEDIGTLKYGSSLMNITFDPTNPNQLASYAADSTGNIAEKTYIIKNGLLLRGLGGFESEYRMKNFGSSVANQRACSWNRPPIDRMANLNLEPGKSSFDEIIGSIEKGVLMDANRSWSIDDYRNKFQFGCEYGKLIENGKITKTVKNPNYRGITNKFWKGLSAVGNKDTFEVYGTPNCGKGEPNQIIHVGHASPVCAFDNVEVFGGGK
ncbi:MAG: Zn-dependent protease [Treponema sp.]|nr:MAG: Zn-dependent protease [Treponema sp.]